MGSSNKHDLKQVMKAAATQVVRRTPCLQPASDMSDHLLAKLVELDRIDSMRLQGRQDEIEA